jgi:hypothetical protein
VGMPRNAKYSVSISQPSGKSSTMRTYGERLKHASLPPQSCGCGGVSVKLRLWMTLRQEPSPLRQAFCTLDEGDASRTLDVVAEGPNLGALPGLAGLRGPSLCPWETRGTRTVSRR